MTTIEVEQLKLVWKKNVKSFAKTYSGILDWMVPAEEKQRIGDSLKAIFEKAENEKYMELFFDLFRSANDGKKRVREKIISELKTDLRETPAAKQETLLNVVVSRIERVSWTTFAGLQRKA